MEIVATHTYVIVPEVLRGGNYKRWSILMRYYLLGQDLWDVVQSSQLPAGGNMSGEWMKKNALALHAIMISCGEEIFDQIKEKDSAKDVWDALADMCKRPVVEHLLERLEGPGNHLSSQYKTLTTAISNGDLSRVKKFFRENPNARSAKIFENGYTALHFAVYNRKTEIVDYMIEFKLSKEDVEIRDNFGSTALSIAARYGVEKSIAQKLVGKNRNLLIIPDNDEKIPVELACRTIREDLTHYLYCETPLQSPNVDNDVGTPLQSPNVDNDVETPLQSPNVDNGVETPLQYLNADNGSRILQECITRKMFGIVFDLLHHFPDLASPSCSLNSIPPILRLVQTQPPFFRRNNLSFWERRIYNWIIAKAYVIKEDKHRSCAEKIQDFFQTRTKMIQHCFESCGKKIRGMIQDFQARNQARNQAIIQKFREFQESSFEEKCVTLARVAGTIIMLPFMVVCMSPAVLLMAVFLIVVVAAVAVEISLFVSLIPVGLIFGALRILVSILSWCFETDLYKMKLMDLYARKVIKLICQPLSQLDQNPSMQTTAEKATIQAIENGIPDIVKEIRKANANILWSNKDPEDSRSRIQELFALAVKHRQEEVAHLLYESEKEKNMLFTTDADGNNTLHLAAKLPPHYQLCYIHTAALQLQSEIRWFKAVKEIVPGAYINGKNTDNETPLEVFVREHKEFLKGAEEWVKKTAESSTVVGALIITIMFAVAFSVPGGNDQSTGFPVLLHKTPTLFMVFMVSDVISLFTATSSVIMFLGILTSHHSDEDYRNTSLLIMGLTLLFVSVATMTTAYCAALFIMLQGQGGLGLVIPMSLLAGIPIVCYVWLQFPLLVEILDLTFNSNIFRKKGTSPVGGRTVHVVTWGMRTLMRER